MKYFIILTGLLLAGCTGGQDTQFTQLSDLEEAPFQEALESRVEQETAELKIGRKKNLSTEQGQVGENAFKDDETGVVTEETTVTETTQTTDETDIEVDVIVDVRTKGKKTSTTTTEATATAQVKTAVDTEDCVSETTVKKTDTKKKKKGKKKIYVKTRDIHFYIGPGGWNKSNCFNRFVQNTYRKGFLVHLKGVDWRFSHSLFSSAENSPGYLEHNGRYVGEIHRAFQRKTDYKTVLTKNFQYYEDIFAYTITPFVQHGGSFYVNHSTAARDNTIQYDAPKYDHKIHKDGGDDPLVGLDNLLTNKYDGAIRHKSQVVEVFVASDKFPNYSPEDIRDFLKEHKRVRIHALYVSSQAKIGSLPELVEKTGGSIHHLCGGNKNIGPELAEVIKQKPKNRKSKKKKCKKKKN